MTTAALLGALTVLATYAEAVDARDADRIAAVLTDDVRLTRPGGTVEGIDAFLDAYRPFLEGDALGSRHSVSNQIPEQTGQGRVTIRSCFEATVFSAGATRRTYGRYEDDIVLRDGRWLIAHKRNFMEWSLDLPPATRL